MVQSRRLSQRYGLGGAAIGIGIVLALLGVYFSVRLDGYDSAQASIGVGGMAALIAFPGSLLLTPIYLLLERTLGFQITGTDTALVAAMLLTVVPNWAGLGWFLGWLLDRRSPSSAPEDARLTCDSS